MADSLWYNDPFFVAVVVVILTLATNRVGGRLERRAQRKQRAAQLKIAFAAEVETILHQLEPVVEGAIRAWETRQLGEVEVVWTPRCVFDANAAQLGDLGDKELVYFLVMMYSNIERVNKIRSTAGDDSTQQFKERLGVLLVAWPFTVGAYSVLRQITKDTIERPVVPRVSAEDAKRLNVTVDCVNRLLRESTGQNDDHESS